MGEEIDWDALAKAGKGKKDDVTNASSHATSRVESPVTNTTITVEEKVTPRTRKVERATTLSRDEVDALVAAKVAEAIATARPAKPDVTAVLALLPDAVELLGIILASKTPGMNVVKRVFTRNPTPSTAPVEAILHELREHVKKRLEGHEP